MSLGEAVSKYLLSSDAHDSSQGTDYINLVHLLKNVTMGQLNFEYNALCQQRLWTTPLTDIFYDEILNRLYDETTFSIFISWTTIESWTANPWVKIFLGFEDIYPILTKDGDYILLENEVYNSYSLMNSSFNDDDEKTILRLLLTNKINAYVMVTDNIQIVGIENADVPEERLLFFPDIDITKTYRISTKITEFPDWNAVKRMLISVKQGAYELVDDYKPEEEE